MTDKYVAMETLVEFAVVVRHQPYSDGRADVEARGLNTSHLYTFQQGRYSKLMRPGDPIAVYRPATETSMKVIDMAALKERYRFAVINENADEVPPETA